MTLRHRQVRLRWARAHRRWRRRDWTSVLFSDESRFNLSHADGRGRLYRRRGERFALSVLDSMIDLEAVVLWYGVG